jgi:hypothetical protein
VSFIKSACEKSAPVKLARFRLLPVKLQGFMVTPDKFAPASEMAEKFELVNLQPLKSTPSMASPTALKLTLSKWQGIHLS